MLLPTAFLGLDVLAGLDLETGVFEAAGLLSLGLLALASAAGLLEAEGFLEGSCLDGAPAFAASGLLVLGAAGRVIGDAVGFLAAGVVGLLASFLMGAGLLVVWEGVRPADGVVGLVDEDLGVVVVVLTEGEGFAAAAEDLGVVGAADFGAAEGGRDAAVLGLVVLETGGFSVLVADPVLGLVADAVPGLVVAAGLEVGPAVVFGFALSPLTAVVGVFLRGAAGGFVTPTGFFSISLVADLAVTAFVGAAGFLVTVVFFSGAALAVFLATPLLCAFCTPLVRRLCVLLGRAPGAEVFVGVLVLGALFVLGSLAVLEAAAGGSGCPISTWPSATGASWMTGSASSATTGSMATVSTPSGFMVSPQCWGSVSLMTVTVRG